MLNSEKNSTICAEENANDGWKILLNRYKLMPNVHAEEGANEIFTLTQDLV
jgi:hypothetical protein